jgi:glycosyltransferase involved in cell wall biosynthesis
MRRTILFLEQQSWLGGAQRVLEATLDSLCRTHDCMVTFPDRGPFRKALEGRKIETVDLPIGSYAPGRKSLLEMATFVWRSVYCGLKLAAFIRRRRIALVYINGPRCLPAGVLAALLTGRPTIFHLHLILERRLEVMLATRLARRVSRVLACSHAAAASLLDHDRSLWAKTQVLYNPLSRQQAHATSSGKSYLMPDRFTIGMVSRITETKGHHLLLRAVGKLPPTLRERVQLLIVGSPAPDCESDRQYAELLRDEAVRLGLDQQILWTGYQSDPFPYYASMDVLVHPALAEAMCIVILEALDSGVPVIASRTGGIAEVVQNGFNGLLVYVEDESALSEALASFITDPSMRDRLREGARRRLDPRFSMETFSSGVRAVVNEVCPPESSAEAELIAGVGKS